MNRSIAVAIALLAAAFASGCSPTAPQLAGREFVSIGVTDGGSPRPLAPATSVLMRFTATDLSGDAGCNGFGGGYRVDGGRLVIDNFSMTAMACDPERDAQDTWLLAFLASKPTISLVGTDLRVESGSVVLTLRDREVVEPDVNLVGPTWTLEAIITGDAVSSVPLGVEATLVFKDDGTIEVNAGCNRGSGRWAAVGGGIEFGPVMLTKMACQKDGATVESAVVGVLGAGTVTATIDNTMLTLLAGGQGLQYRAS